MKRAFIFMTFFAGLFSMALPAQAAECKTDNQKRKVGGLIGGLAVGILGKKMNSLGLNSSFQRELKSFLGTTIACSLSEQEQKKAIEAQNQALNSGKTGSASSQKWQSGERQGVGGGTRIVSRNNVDGKMCAVTATFITDETGKEIAVEKELCQGADKSWT